MKFQTESGSIYEVDGDHIRRLNEHPKRGKRADGEWIRLVEPVKVELGACAILQMESLSKYGADDYGTIEASDVTVRMTTPVERVWGE